MSVATPTLAGLPRLLAGVAEHGSLDLVAHLDVHGPAPELPAPGRGRHSALIDEVEAAGLRGRGGAGYPTALKMHAVTAARGRRRTMVVVNAAEGEPASLKDRTLLESTPHLVLDGAALAARAVAAGEIVVCVGEDTPEVLATVSAAAAERNRLRERIPMRIAAVPGGYVAGQESAIVNHLDGRAAKPRHTPPMIFERGVGGRPTLLSNAETFAHVAQIARHGAGWFRGLGTAEHPGSTLVTLGGPVVAPGVYEIGHGTSLRSLVDAAGGLTESLRAVLIGGYSGTWIGASQAGDLTLDDGCLAPHGASTGAGVVALLGESACPVAETVRVASWLADESAGQCGPCIFGLDAVAGRLDEWAAGLAGDGREEQLRLASVIRGRGACRHPDGALRFVASAIRVFAAEFADHGSRGPCGACTAAPSLPLPGYERGSPTPALAGAWR
ncbi:MAG TPA: NADH-ubiquinone oxidoreductase-F iron-sulfur binding region domain-containing protein [Solirubrobacteraceae bacterium]|jgi:NADH:ubiquinone oxidoreductase subunit F (NADH-binding)|nr:NADH-ubiquinone oxidoreductase-F iron-sulfur binding region domain-containing protein [Solirubrobacteraceae bacterium]